MEPQLTKYQGTGESCSLSRVRYIEHFDLTNFLKKKKQPKCLLYRGIVINLPNPAILGSEQLLITPQYRAVYGYGTRNSKTGKQTA